MRSLIVGVSIAVWCLAVCVPGVAVASPVADSGGVSSDDEGGDSPRVLGERMYINGFVEFSLDPHPDLTPPSMSVQRPADKTAFSFLRANMGLLEIHQEPADFRVSSVIEDEPGVWIVTVDQSYQGYDVDTASLVFTVQAQTVVHIEARYVADVSMLPICVPNDGLLEMVDAYAESMGFPPDSRTFQGKFFYRPYGSETHLAMLESMDVSDARLLMVVDVCNGVILDGYTERVEP